MSNNAFIHPTAMVEKNVTLGERTNVWHHCQVREGSVLGNDVNLGKGVFIDSGVQISNGCRIQNGVSVYSGVMLHEWVFVGPNVTFTNDRNPRAGARQWKKSETILEAGCSIGAGSVITCGTTIGAFAMIGAGSVLTDNVPAFHLSYGLPARIVSKICACGETRLDFSAKAEDYLQPCCPDNLKDEVLSLAMSEIEKLK
jgi:UDP-2-acetamido-3-amino-2,3-dideoxy-glucuronate N-acetyltransferase